MSMINDRVELSVENHIAHVQLSREDKMNALDEPLLKGLLEAAATIKNDNSVRVVVISGKGKAFCAGLDMMNFAALLDPNGDKSVTSNLSERTHGIANEIQYVAWAWRELAVPVIAAVHGVCVGGGLQIALAADMRYAAPDARFSILEMRWGIIPDMSSTQLMRHHVPEDAIRELTYTARMFDVEEAREYSFVTKIVDDPVAHAFSVAEQIVKRNPHAVRASKRILNEANYVSAAEGLLMESQEQDKIMGTANQLEAVMSEMEKRPAKFID